jgi:hypothetical protein
MKGEKIANWAMQKTFNTFLTLALYLSGYDEYNVLDEFTSSELNLTQNFLSCGAQFQNHPQRYEKLDSY